MDAKKVLLCEFDSWGLAYEQLSQVVAEPKTQVLEFGQISNGKIILVCEGTDFKDISFSATLIEQPHAQLLPAYFKLNAPALEKNLCIIESSSLGEVFQAADEAAKRFNFDILEIYRACNGYQQAWAILCNGTEEPVLTNFDGSVKLIPQLHDGLESFF